MNTFIYIFLVYFSATDWKPHFFFFFCLLERFLYAVHEYSVGIPYLERKQNDWWMFFFSRILNSNKVSKYLWVDDNSAVLD